MVFPPSRCSVVYPFFFALERGHVGCDTRGHCIESYTGGTVAWARRGGIFLGFDCHFPLKSCVLDLDLCHDLERPVSILTLHFSQLKKDSTCHAHCTQSRIPGQKQRLWFDSFASSSLAVTFFKLIGSSWLYQHFSKLQTQQLLLHFTVLHSSRAPWIRSKSKVRGWRSRE